MFKNIIYLLTTLLLSLPVDAADVKPMQNLFTLWKKQHSELRFTKPVAFFVTSVDACSLCGQSGFNTLMQQFKRELPDIERVIVIVGADEIELRAYIDLYPNNTAIVAAKSNDATKAFSVEVFPTFYLVSPEGVILFKQEDVTHNLPSIDSLRYYSVAVSKGSVPVTSGSQSTNKTQIKVIRTDATTGKSLSISTTEKKSTQKIVVRKISEKTPLVQLGAITYPKGKSIVAYLVDKAQNATLQFDLSGSVIDTFYKVENKLEYWFKKDSSIFTWSDGFIDSTDHWKEFQQLSALTQIKGIVYDSLGLLMLCRLHTGMKREVSSGRKRLSWQVGNGFVRLSNNAIPQEVQLISTRKYIAFPPVISLSNGDILSRVFWEGYYEGNNKSSQQKIRDSAAIFGTYNPHLNEMRISTNSSAFFNEDIDDENTSIYPDDKSGFFGINSKYKWFFRAVASGGDYEYKSIERKGIWKSQEQKIRCFDCFYSDGIFYVTISLDNGELWLQRYNSESGRFTEKKLMSLKKNSITQMKVVKYNDMSFSILAKFQNTRWHCIDVKL